MAEASRWLTCRRYGSLVLACVVIAVAGSILTFSNYATHLKNEFQLTQKAVEIIGATGNIGAACGYPAGLLYEHVGSSRSFFLSLALTGTSMTLLYATQFSISFYHNNWALIALYIFIFGVGNVFMFLVPTSVCMANFPARMRGAIVGLTASFFMAGPAVFGVIYASLFAEGPLGNYFLMLAIVYVVMNLISMFAMRPVPLEENSLSQEQLCHEGKCSVSFLKDGENCSSDGWVERLGLDLLKIPAFHTLSWCFLLGCSLQLMLFANITTIATSYGYHKLSVSLPIYGPIAAFLSTALLGFISDRTINYISRLFYVFIGQSLQTLFFLLSITLGDDSRVFSGLVLCTYINNGFLFAIIPTLISEYFGTRHFIRNWGAQLMANAVLALILGTVVGELYENAITDGGTDCYGLLCFQNTYIMGSVMGGAAVFLCGVLWCMERQKSKEYSLID